MLPGTQRLAVSSLSASGSPAAHAAASGQVMSLRAISGPHLSPASAPHFLSTSCDPLDSGSTIRSYPPLAPPVSPADRPLAARIANTPPSPGNKEGFRQGLRVSGHVSVLIGHFFCAAVVQSASSWGQARLGAVTDASCRAAAANLGGEYRIGFSKKAKSSQKDRAVEEGERLRSGPVLAVPVLALCASELMMLSSLAGQRPALFRAARRDTNKPRRGLSLGEVAGHDALHRGSSPSPRR